VLLGTGWYGCGLKDHLAQNEMKTHSSRLFKCSLFMYSFTELPEKASITIASDFVWP
jgi:hypothetical protein